MISTCLGEQRHGRWTLEVGVAGEQLHSPVVRGRAGPAPFVVLNPVSAMANFAPAIEDAASTLGGSPPLDSSV